MVSVAPLATTNFPIAQLKVIWKAPILLQVGNCSEMLLQKPAIQMQVEIHRENDGFVKEQPACYHQLF